MLNRIYLIVCEGRSEAAYVQEVNRFLRETEKGVFLTPCNAGSGNFKVIRKVCRSRKIPPGGSAYVMVDRDIYERNDGRNGDLYARGFRKLPTFLFQYFNFEDFLIMHFPRECCEAWRRRMEPFRHFSVPLREEKYRGVFRDFCGAHLPGLREYEKGDIPFSLTEWHFRNLFANNHAGRLPKSDFAEFMETRLFAEFA